MDSEHSLIERKHFEKLGVNIRAKKVEFFSVSFLLNSDQDAVEPNQGGFMRNKIRRRTEKSVWKLLETLLHLKGP